ncbi:hypothetical protein [uncultured Thiohalocapsa sp.]|uniref:hypothetical protein n=1 Tax=uncultured Thiohalocapsa sp. TaxID=768990 RepID=UPI0025F88838|nr:hypothetical protein [uncultured Thiohalocapsa sp.]
MTGSKSERIQKPQPTDGPKQCQPDIRLAKEMMGGSRPLRWNEASGRRLSILNSCWRKNEIQTKENTPIGEKTKVETH